MNSFENNKKIVCVLLSLIFLISFVVAVPIVTITEPADSSTFILNETINLNWSVSEPIISCNFNLNGGADNTSIISQNYSVSSDFILETSSNTPHSVHVNNNFLFEFKTDGFIILNISDKSSPTLFSNYTNSTSLGSISAILEQDGFVYLGARSLKSFTIVDVSDKANPIQISSINDTTLFPSPTQIVISGNFAYLINDGFANNYLTIIDITDKSNPFVVSSLTNSTSGGATGIYATGNFVYVTSANRELKVIDVTDKSSPVRVGSLRDISVFDGLTSIDGDDSISYVVSSSVNLGQGALVSINITDKTNPTVLSFFNGTGDIIFRDPSKVVFNNDYVFLTVRARGHLFVLDASTTNLILISAFEDLLFGVTSLDVQDSFAYVRGESLGVDRLYIVNISADTQDVFLSSSLIEGGHNLILTCSDFEDLVQDSSSFTVGFPPPPPQFPDKIQGEGAIFEVMQSSGAGLGSFIQFMSRSLPVLLIILVMVGIIVAVGFGIATVIRRSIQGVR